MRFSTKSVWYLTWVLLCLDITDSCMNNRLFEGFKLWTVNMRTRAPFVLQLVIQKVRLTFTPPVFLQVLQMLLDDPSSTLFEAYWVRHKTESLAPITFVLFWVSWDFFFFFFTWPHVWIFILVNPITRMNIGNVRHCKWMMKLCVYLKVSNFTFLSVIHLLLWQLCACGLVRFWHKKHLGRLRKRSCFGLKYLVPGEVSTSKQLSNATNMAGTWSPH